MDENQDKIMITPAEEPDGDGAPSAAELGEEGAPAEQASETPAVPPEEPDLKYKNGKEVTIKRLYLETMEDVLAHSDKVIINPSEKGSNVLPYLPLDRINKTAKTQE